MGNQGSKTGVALKFDQQIHVAGQEVTGTVYVALDKKQKKQKQTFPLYLSLKGIEHVVMEQKSSKAGTRAFQHSTVDLVNSQWKIADVNPSTAKSKRGQYEFPFRFRLPNHLPSSMECRESSKSNNTIRVTYTLNASLGDISTAAKELQVRAEPRPEANQEPCRIESQTHPVTQYFSFWKKGKVHLGWELPNGGAVSPFQTVPIRIWGYV